MVNQFLFPFTFDVTEIKKTLLELPEDTWVAHYNKNDYEGDWSVIPLRSGWGHPSNIYSVPMPPEHFKNTPLMELFPEVQTILETLLCVKTSVRFMRLCTGAEIKEHCDDRLDILEGEARLHIPVQTHSLLEFYLNKERIHMQEGECWYLNFNMPHSVKNPGPLDRIHLVIDCITNEWLMEQMHLNNPSVQ